MKDKLPVFWVSQQAGLRVAIDKGSPGIHAHFEGSPSRLQLKLDYVIQSSTRSKNSRIGIYGQYMSTSRGCWGAQASWPSFAFGSWLSTPSLLSDSILWRNGLQASHTGLLEEQEQLDEDYVTMWVCHASHDKAHCSLTQKGCISSSKNHQ